jgi:TRAP transporter TAXI family solute receptor
MKWLGAVVLMLVSVTTLAGAQSSARPKRTELMMLTGPESGTYYLMGRDIRRLLDEVVPDSGIDFAVIPSQGALQNLIDVFRYTSFQLGVTQNDVLAYLEIYARGDAEVRRAVGGMQIVGHLYDEEVHLIARPGINGLADLAGKRIDIGPPGSGTTVTALVLLHLAGVEPREVVNLPVINDAISALRRGRIDAFFRVIAAPGPALRDDISTAHGFSLVPIRLTPKPEEAALARHYTPTVIRANTYPWLDHAVDTVKIGTTVATAGANPGTPACAAIGRLVRIVYENQPWLQANGHAKWSELRRATAEILRDPRISPCVVQEFR